MHKRHTMESLKLRKNFVLDRDVIEKASAVLKHKHKNLTEAINTYFQAIVKDPSLLDKVEDAAKKRTGGFIGMLDGESSGVEYEQMKKARHEDIS